MDTLESFLEEFRRILLYEIALGDPSQEDDALSKALNRAYREVCYHAETPVLVHQVVYPDTINDPKTPVIGEHMVDLSQHGLRSVYRVWWRRNVSDADEIDLMDALYLEPEQDYRHLGSQRVLPSPIKEYRLPYPRIRWLPQKIRGSDEDPETFVFVDGKIVLDSRASGVLRIIGSFYPTEHGPVRFLKKAPNPVKSVLPSALNEAVLYLAISYWLMPYPDQIQLSQYYRNIGFETILMHQNVAQSGVFARSPYAYAENMMGVIGQETNRKKKQGQGESG